MTVNMYAPTGVANNQANCWSDEARSDVNSPVFEWPKGILEKECFAKALTEYPLTLMDVQPWVLNGIIAPCLSHKSMMFIEDPGVGKTPLSLAVGCVHYYNENLASKTLLPLRIVSTWLLQK
eukprot:5958678-Amphidinium_carterae.1